LCEKATERATIDTLGRKDCRRQGRKRGQNARKSGRRQKSHVIEEKGGKGRNPKGDAAKSANREPRKVLSKQGY